MSLVPPLGYPQAGGCQGFRHASGRAAKSNGLSDVPTLFGPPPVSKPVIGG